MNRRCFGYAVGSVIVGLSAVIAIPASAQSSRVLLGQREARQIGLQPMWFTQVEMDPGRGELLHLTQHVSSTKATTVHEIKYDGGRVVISERDVDRFGALIGPENAKKAVAIKLNDLTNLKLNPKLETITVPQITLYAVTDAGVVQAIDAETGRTLWKTGVGDIDAPQEAVGASDSYVAVISGSDLYLLKAENGEFIWKRRVVGGPGAGPAITSHLVFVPMIGGAMEAYSIDDTAAAPRIYKSQGRAMWQPIYTGSNVAWPTDRGHLYVSGATQNRISFRLEANDAIAAPATMMGSGKIVASSIDGFVYCLQESSGIVLWRFSSGEPILESPAAYGDTVYAVTTDGNLFALDGDLGQDRWSIRGISKVLGASTTRLYCETETGNLVVIDQKTGGQLGSMGLGSSRIPFMNKQTDRIVLANRRGLIQSLREIQLEYPVIHIGLSKAEEASAAPAAKKAAPDPDGAPAEPAANPFAPGAPSDPFGAPEKKGDDEDKGDKKADDPFSPFGDD